MPQGNRDAKPIAWTQEAILALIDPYVRRLIRKATNGDGIGGGGGDHGLLVGLSDDDHTQYLLDAPGTGGDGISVSGRTITAELGATGGLGIESGDIVIDIPSLPAGPDVYDATDTFAMYDASANDHVEVPASQMLTQIGMDGLSFLTVDDESSNLPAARQISFDDGFFILDGGDGGSYQVFFDLDNPGSGLQVTASGLSINFGDGVEGGVGNQLNVKLSDGLAFDVGGNIEIDFLASNSALTFEGPVGDGVQVYLGDLSALSGVEGDMDRILIYDDSATTNRYLTPDDLFDEMNVNPRDLAYLAWRDML